MTGADAEADAPCAAAQAYVHARVGQHDLAVSLRHVVRAVPLPAAPLPTLPRLQGALAGLIEVDGLALPLVSLERWLPMGPATATAQQRVLVLTTDAGMVGLVVDQVFEVQNVNPGRIRQIHHEDADGELFHSAIDPLNGAPILCLLEVGRLMRMCGVWCSGAGWDMPGTRSTQRPAAAETKGAKVPHAVFRLDGEYWAMPTACVERVIATPTIELRLRPGGLALGICEIDDIKMPLIAIGREQAATTGGSGSRGWTAVLRRGSQRMGFLSDECERVVDIADGDMAMALPTDLLRGVALLPEGIKLQVLNTDNLFAAVPEANLARAPAPPGAEAVVAGRSGHGNTLSHYLIFEADCEYAAPVDGGIVGVIELPEHVIGDLRENRRAVVPWRGKSCNVINMPPINSRSRPFTPRLAVLVQGKGPQAPVVGVAIASLRDWLPAHRADRIEMRLGSLGEFGLIQPRGSPSSLVVVDLAQMGYMVG